MTKTSNPKKHIDELHFEHRIWTNNMKFYRDELKIFENRLEELVTRNTKLEVTAQIEHFQNQFILQREKQLKKSLANAETTINFWPIKQKIILLQLTMCCLLITQNCEMKLKLSTDCTAN